MGSWRVDRTPGGRVACRGCQFSPSVCAPRRGYPDGVDAGRSPRGTQHEFYRALNRVPGKRGWFPVTGVDTGVLTREAWETRETRYYVDTFIGVGHDGVWLGWADGEWYSDKLDLIIAAERLSTARVSLVVPGTDALVLSSQPGPLAAYSIMLDHRCLGPDAAVLGDIPVAELQAAADEADLLAFAV